MVHAQQISKVFRTRRSEVRALNVVTLDVQAGEFVVIRGPSGSGKTTLLFVLGGMLRPTSGKVVVHGRELYALSRRERADFRARHVGFVFQMFHLVPYLTVEDNVLLAAPPGEAPALRTRAAELLSLLGLAPRVQHRPAELSAGERQRTAIARAMLNRPDLILADEPTGNLDPRSAAEVIAGLAAFHRQAGTVILVTHGTVADQYASRVIHLDEGMIAHGPIDLNAE